MLNKLDFEHKPARAIIVLTSLVALGLSIIGLVFIPDKLLVVSFLIGVIASILGFLLSVFRTDLILQEQPSRPGVITTIGFLFNYILYGAALYLCLKIEALNVFACLVGLLLMKVTIYLKYGVIDLRHQEKKLPKKEGDMIE